MCKYMDGVRVKLQHVLCEARDKMLKICKLGWCYAFVRLQLKSNVNVRVCVCYFAWTFDTQLQPKVRTWTSRLKLHLVSAESVQYDGARCVLGFCMRYKREKLKMQKKPLSRVCFQEISVWHRLTMQSPGILVYSVHCILHIAVCVSV